MLFFSPSGCPCLPQQFNTLLGPSPRSQSPHQTQVSPQCNTLISWPSLGAGGHDPQKMGEETVSGSAHFHGRTEDRVGTRARRMPSPWLCLWSSAPASCDHHPGTVSGQPGLRCTNSPMALYRNKNTSMDRQTDRRGFSPLRWGGALCHAPAVAPCSPQIPSSSSPSLSAKSSPCFLAPDPGDQTQGDTTAQNREQNRERIQKQQDCSVAQQASSGPGPRTGRRDGKN